jgi:hypothetical protein
METNDGLWMPILVAGIAFAINEQFDKILLVKLLPSSIANLNGEFILPATNWVCSWFCMNRIYFGIAVLFSHSTKCAANLCYGD